MSESDWEPETAEFREGETRDDDNTHAQRNAAQASMGDLDDSLPSLHVGDHVTDRDEDDAATMVVVGLPLSRAATYAIDGGTTVADVNPDYPEDDHVIEVVTRSGRTSPSTTRSPTPSPANASNSSRQSTIATTEVRSDVGLRSLRRS